MPSLKTRKNTPRKTLSYKIKRTLRHPFNTMKKKLSRRKARGLQSRNSRQAKKQLKRSTSRPSVTTTHIIPWYVPDKGRRINFDEDGLQYVKPQQSKLLHEQRLRANNKKILKRNLQDSPIRQDDPWGESILNEISRLKKNDQWLGT